MSENDRLSGLVVRAVAEYRNGLSVADREAMDRAQLSMTLAVFSPEGRVNTIEAALSENRTPPEINGDLSLMISAFFFGPTPELEQQIVKGLREYREARAAEWHSGAVYSGEQKA